MSASISCGGNSWPCWVPAAREMLSFISLPPRSLAPDFRQIAAPAGPIFTQDVWMLGISGCRTSRATECMMTASRNVEPLPGVDLVGADDGADFIVENFGRRSGQGAETGCLQLGEELRDR